MERQTFTKRKRFWYCDKCGRTKRRLKSKSDNFNDALMCCGDYMIKSRTTNKADKIRNRRYNKQSNIRKKITNYHDKYCSKVRNMGGTVLKISSETKRLWKQVVKAKTRPYVIKKTQLFIKSIENDSKNVDENKWAKSINDKGIITRSRGGFSAPIIQLRDDMHNTLHGNFLAGFLIGGCFININKNFNITEIKKTILHETLHYLDSLAQIETGHNEYWDMRLKWIENKFKII